MVAFEDGPRIVIWETTRACALACSHCRADAIPYRNPSELSTSEARELVDELADWGKAFLILTGGDPLMRPDLFEIISYAATRGLRVAVSPSATGRLSAKTLKAVFEAGCRLISLSLDGPDAGLHDAFRGVPGVFSRTFDAALEASRVGLGLQINTTITPHNYTRIAEMSTLVAALGAKTWSAFFIVPTGRAKREADLTPEQCEVAFAALFDASEQFGYAVKTTEAPHYRRYVARRLGQMPVSPGIGDGKGFVFVSHTGEIQPSGFLPLTRGTVREASLLDVYRSDPVMRRLRDPDAFGGKCGRCDFRWLCGGSRARAYAVCGDPFASDPACGYEPAAE